MKIESKKEQSSRNTHDETPINYIESRWNNFGNLQARMHTYTIVIRVSNRK